MDTIFKIAMFTFALNLACGIIIFTVPDLDPQYMSIVQPIEYDKSGMSQLVNGTTGDTELPPVFQALANVKDILLDAFYIGKLIRFIDGIGTIIWGFPKIVYGILLRFTPADDPASYISFLNSLKGFMNTIVTISYAIGGFYLWTGKKINGTG